MTITVDAPDAQTVRLKEPGDGATLVIVIEGSPASVAELQKRFLEAYQARKAEREPKPCQGCP